MKAIALTLTLVATPLANVACIAEDRFASKLAPASDRASDQTRITHDIAETRKMKITIGGKSFKATFEEDPAAKELQSLKPLSLRMAELNGNEKHAELPKVLPTDAKKPGTIRAGDLLLYGDRILVLFYKTFKSPYSYTRLGRIDNPSGLATALGRGSVEVTFDTE